VTAPGAWSDRPVHPVRLAALLAMLGMFGPFAIDAMFPAFKAMAADLGASTWAMQQTISVYLVAYGVMSLVHGPLADAFGRRPVVIAGVALFTLASIGCALATSIEALLVFRALQGFSTGAGQIVGRAIVRDLYSDAQAQKVMSLVTMFFAIAPAVAPIVGGLVYSAAGWHAVFWFLALYGAALLLVCLRLLPETHPPSRRHRLALRPLSRQYAAMLRDWRFVLLVAASGFNFGAQFLYISSAPMFVEVHLGLGTMGYSWFFVPMIVGMIAGAALCNRMATRVPPRRTMTIAFAVMAAAQALNLGYNVAVDRVEVPWAVLPILVNALGVAMAFPVLTLKTLDRFPAHRGAASSMQAFIWGGMTAVIAGAMSAWLSGTPRGLAFGSAALIALGWLSWRAFVATTPLSRVEREPHAVEPVRD
jgi:DHA1 family bicyclomycin/chloramphenicol resistance-like MFS transporter